MTLQQKIEQAINECSAENGSNTPDFILAEYLAGCLRAFDAAVNAREQHFNRPRAPLPTVADLEQILAKEET